MGKFLHYSDRNEEAREFLRKAARQGHSKARDMLRWIKEHGE